MIYAKKNILILLIKLLVYINSMIEDGVLQSHNQLSRKDLIILGILDWLYENNTESTYLVGLYKYLDFNESSAGKYEIALKNFYNIVTQNDLNMYCRFFNVKKKDLKSFLEKHLNQIAIQYLKNKKKI